MLLACAFYCILFSGFGGLLLLGVVLLLVCFLVAFTDMKSLESSLGRDTEIDLGRRMFC